MPYDYRDFTKTFLEDKTEFLNRAARYYLLDIIRREMHNEGYALDGNTAESDERWFARLLCDKDRHEPNSWDRLRDEQRGEYLKQARNAMECIPALMSRISNRCIRISEAVNTVIKAEKLHEYYEQESKAPGKRI